MRYPTLRYGHPEALRYYSMGIPEKDLAKILRRSERTIADWKAGKTKVPWWVPEILRLQHFEYQERMRVMGFKNLEKPRKLISANDERQEQSTIPIQIYPS